MNPTDPDPQAAYQAMVAYLSGGDRLLPSRIRTILAAAGKTADSLVDTVLGDATGGGPAPGDVCPVCGYGSLTILNSKRRGTVQVQYLGCSGCGYRPPNNKRRVPAGVIRRRRKQPA